MREQETLLSIRWQQLVEENRLELASNAYKKLVQNNQNTQGQDYIMGVWYHRVGEYQDALYALQQGLKHASDMKDELYYELALVYIDMDYFEDAKYILEKALAQNDVFAETTYLYAEVLATLDEKQSAVYYFKKVLQLEPGNVEICINVAACLSELGEKDEAIEIYHRALLLDESNYYIYSNLAVEYAELGEFEEALFFHQKALKGNPFCSDLWYNLACSYSLMEKIDDALDALEKAIHMDESNKDYAAEDSELINLHQSGRFWKLIQH